MWEAEVRSVLPLHEAWTEMFRQLQQFVSLHGHARVPVMSEGKKNTRLIQWQCSQRKQMIEKLKDGGGGLTFKRIEALAAVGFRWGHHVQKEQVTRYLSSQGTPKSGPGGEARLRSPGPPPDQRGAFSQSLGTLGARTKSAASARTLQSTVAGGSVERHYIDDAKVDRILVEAREEADLFSKQSWEARREAEVRNASSQHEDWMVMFCQLRQFVSLHGHAKVPVMSDGKNHARLIKWQCSQRK
eukprot:CAMPEP_0194309774 /NCGR_PEP_ID=MMETSP0171-20130528/6743_1 /TAXON_ID=218684 /ORGANISM="Corethron pennatum, Strain L29A3" /LENGTH=242 /DNA_ID=CAMNT_0039063097 /DNA_START=135 /DNA_END=860 /DNA_ORIENTATION=-